MDLCDPCDQKLEIVYLKLQRKRKEGMYLKEIRELDDKIAKLEQMETTQENTSADERYRQYALFIAGKKTDL